MENRIEQIMLQQGYHFWQIQPEKIGVFYKYHQEGFHVVMLLDFRKGTIMPEQHQQLENRVLNLFYHPQGELADFPDGFPVYHVELLTLVLCEDNKSARELCAVSKNIWIYVCRENRILIYENQPGDFYGLREVLEAQKEMPKPVLWKQYLTNIEKLPVITIALTAINVLVYVILEWIGDTENALFIASYGGMYPDFLIYEHQWWRLFTAMFLHFGLEHLLNNMVIFCCVGSRLEHTVGHIKMLMIYLFSGICGGFLSYIMMIWQVDYAVSAGASGAVFGVIGGLLWAAIFHWGHVEGLTTRGLVFMIALSLYYGFSTMGVDNWSHIGGMIAGFLMTAILYHRKAQRY